MSVEERAAAWVNVLGREKGDYHDKLRWLVRELPLIEAEAATKALAAKLDPEDEKVIRVFVRPIIIRYWRNYRKDKAASGNVHTAQARRADADRVLKNDKKLAEIVERSLRVIGRQIE